MELLHDYVKWRGDLTFEDDAFNEIDNLVLCQFASLNLMNVKENATVREAFAHLSYKEKAFYRLSKGGMDTLALLESIALSHRFGDLRIQRYEYEYLMDDEMAFQAMTISIDSTSKAIIFGSTNDWKEDLMVGAKLGTIHHKALLYVENQVDLSHTYLFLGQGKGATLALYCACNMSSPNQLEHLYMNNGSSLAQDILDPRLVLALDEKITKINPAFSTIARLYEPELHDVRIVESMANGVQQHNVATWQIDGLEFVEKNQYDTDSAWLYGVLHQWFEYSDQQERLLFIQKLEHGLEQASMSSIYDMSKQGVAALETVFLSLMYCQEDMGEAAYSYSFGGLFENVLSPFKEVAFLPQAWLIERMISLVLVIVGFATILIPSGAINGVVEIAIFVTTIIEAYILGKTFLKKGWSIKEQLQRSMILLVFLSMSLFILTKQTELYVFGTLVFGIGFLGYGLYNIKKATSAPSRSTSQVVFGLEAICFFLFGFFILVSSNNTAYWYSTSAGLLLMVFGCIEMIHTVLALGIDLIKTPRN